MKDARFYKTIIGFLLTVIFLQWLFIISRPKVVPIAGAKVPVKLKAKIAIVIDDWGYNLNNLHILDRIDSPLTCSVLPALSYSREISEELHRRGREIILHLPMEPHEKYRLEKNTILTSMDETTIGNVIEQDLINVIYAKGVSNHMGSLATENARTMEIIFKELKKRGLFFLDSFVTSNTVCSGLASRMGLPLAKRDVFLDNTQDPDYIKKQIYKLKMKAKSKAWAIGICHNHPVTLEVLAQVIPELKKEGYKFVFVSELVK